MSSPQRRKVLGENADRSAFLAVDEVVVTIGERRLRIGSRRWSGWHGDVLRWRAYARELGRDGPTLQSEPGNDLAAEARDPRGGAAGSGSSPWSRRRAGRAAARCGLPSAAAGAARWDRWCRPIDRRPA